jgi:hypothetical protein
MDIYETESGYQVRETLSGLEVTDDGNFVCELGGKTLDDYLIEEDGYPTDDIDDDALEADIKEQIEVDDFLAYQQEYC